MYFKHSMIVCAPCFASWSNPPKPTHRLSASILAHDHRERLFKHDQLRSLWIPPRELAQPSLTASSSGSKARTPRMASLLRYAMAAAAFLVASGCSQFEKRASCVGGQSLIQNVIVH
jgi:hypothetical protein